MITDFSPGDRLYLRYWDEEAGSLKQVSFPDSLLMPTKDVAANVDKAIEKAGLGGSVFFAIGRDYYFVLDSGTDSTTFQDGEDLVIKLKDFTGSLYYQSEVGGGYVETSFF